MVIVGYGPVGQTLAALLASKGHSVAVYERFSGLYELPRAAYFDDEIMQVWQSLGIVDELDVLPVKAYEWFGADGETIARMEHPALGPSGWEPGYLFFQPRLERALDRAVKALPSVEVHRGWSAEALEPAGDHVALTLRRSVPALRRLGIDHRRGPQRLRRACDVLMSAATRSGPGRRRPPPRGPPGGRPLLVLEPLAACLDAHGLGAGELEVEPASEGGHFNVTYAVRRDGAELSCAGRRGRRSRTALTTSCAKPACCAPEGRARVPEVLAACADESVIGAPFNVMERLHGHVVTATVPAALDTLAERRRIADELIDALAELHAVDRRAASLEDFGRATRLSRTPAAPLPGLLGAQLDTRDPRGRARRAPASRAPARLAGDHDRPRRLPARQHDDGSERRRG